jgi:alpha-tubulin suppressor-like RCC1 family protein
VRKNGKLYCWGLDNEGQVGDGEATVATAPRRIGTFEDWASVSAGDFHTCGIRHGGKLYCWGNDLYGQRGDGVNDTVKTAPLRIGTFEDWFNTSAGGNHSCAVRTNGKLYCWGYDNSAQVGDGNNPDPALAPRRI